MTTQVHATGAEPPAAPPRPGSFASRLLLVAALDLRQRLRAGRWRWLLLTWFVICALVTYGIYRSTAPTSFTSPVPLGGGPASSFEVVTDVRGPAMFGGLMVFVLGLGLLVAPALTAQAVNGRRERGTLALLQVSRLSAGEIAGGIALAAWGTALVFLLSTEPLVIWAMSQGGVSVSQVVVVQLLIAVVFGAVVLVSFALSAVLNRTTTSGVVSYLAVAALSIGTLVAFGLATTAFTETRERTYRYTDQSGAAQNETYTTTEARTDRVWWLLVPNPFVLLADATPDAPQAVPRGQEGQPVFIGTLDGRAEQESPLVSLRRSVRDLRLTPDQRYQDTQGSGELVAAAPEQTGGPIWPYGLAFYAALGAGGLLLTRRRLQTPVRRLPKGQRIA